MKKALITLAALATAVIFAAPANAGGKHLRFGGPLGSFVASPHSGGSTHASSYNKRKLAAKKAAQRRAAAKKAAARRAYAKKVAAQKAAARARQQAKIATVEKKNESSSDWKAPLKISAIAGTNTLKFRKYNEPAEVQAEETKVENTKTAELQPETTEVAELECKRFIPSAGMTITVPCGQ